MAAQSLRLAVWNADLSRDGPGLLLRDILSDKDPGVEVVLEGIATVAPDLLLLTRFDHDLRGMALRALADRLAAQGQIYPYLLAPEQNRGLQSGVDLDGNGRFGEADDAHGYGRFSGDGAMAVLSKLPLAFEADHSGFLWRDLPEARLTAIPEAARGVHRLSSSAHWQLRVGGITLLAWAATPPLFSATSRNSDRNHDEAAFWLHMLDGRLPGMPEGPFVLIGHPNLGRGQGDAAALEALASHPRLQPVPHGPTVELAIGPARLSLIQPSRGLRILGSGLFPENADAGQHRLVWVDLEPP